MSKHWEWIGVVLVLLMIISLGLGMWYLSRKLGVAGTPFTVIEPEPGIHCVLVGKEGSLSVDCWRIDAQTQEERTDAD